MTRFLPYALSTLTFLLPAAAASQEPPEANREKGEAQRAAGGSPDAAKPSQQEAAEGASSTPGDDIDALRRRALVDYGVGHIDSAHAELERLIKSCDDQGEAQCPDTIRARLYVALAIVLAGGKDDIKGGARLFHAALTRDPEVTVPREFATRPVQAAMREANESTSYEELSGATEKVEPKDAPKEAPEPPAEEEVQKPSPSDNKTGILLIHGLAGAGGDDSGDGGALGAAMVLGARFVDTSAWTTAIRGRAAIVGLDEEGVGGVSLMMGGSWFNPNNRRMGYLMGGLGLDSYGGEGGFSLNGMGGVSLGGFLVGGGVDFGASGYGGFGMMTLHLGWGARL